MSPLELGVVASGAWALVLLGALQQRARAYGQRVLFAAAAGDPRRGVIYGFGKGMSPAAKESVREHLPTWFAGIGYHLGIVAALGFLVLIVTGLEAPEPLRRGLQVLLAAGTLAGTGLLGKRILQRHLRRLSRPDDYISNTLTTAFLALALARTIWPRLEGVFLAESILLLLWVPLGKIRHCLFFFTTRYQMAAHFGRRGTFPPAA